MVKTEISIFLRKPWKGTEAEEALTQQVTAALTVSRKLLKLTKVKLKIFSEGFGHWSLNYDYINYASESQKKWKWIGNLSSLWY